MNKYFFVVVSLLVFGCSSFIPSQPKTDSALIGRHPDEWMSNYNAFSAYNSISFAGKEVTPFKDGNTLGVDFRLVWNEPSCSDAISSRISFGSIEIRLYENITSVKGIYNAYEKDVDQFYDGYQYSETINLITNNTGKISYYQFSSCDSSETLAEILFRRNNAIGFINIQTFQKNANTELKSIVTDLGSQIDQLFLDEINSHPSNGTEVVDMINSAKTVELPSSASQSEIDSSGSNNGSNTGQCYMDSYGNCHSADQCARIVNGTCILLAELQEQIEKDSQQNSSP